MTARTKVPALVAEVRRLRAELAALRPDVAEAARLERAGEEMIAAAAIGAPWRCGPCSDDRHRDCVEPCGCAARPHWRKGP